MFDNIFFWAQGLGFIAMALSILALQLKKSRHIILMSIPISSLWGVQYIMLGAPLGAVMNLCSIFKDVGLGFGKDRYVPYFIASYKCITWSVGLYFFEFWYDIFPLIGATIINFALLQRDNRALIARATIVCCLFWIVYNVIVESWMGLGTGVLVIASSMIGMARHEEWEIGQCYRSFLPNLTRALFDFPKLKTYP